MKLLHGDKSKGYTTVLFGQPYIHRFPYAKRANAYVDIRVVFVNQEKGKDAPVPLNELTKNQLEKIFKYAEKLVEEKIKGTKLAFSPQKDIEPVSKGHPVVRKHGSIINSFNVSAHFYLSW